MASQQTFAFFEVAEAAPVVRARPFPSKVAAPAKVAVPSKVAAPAKVELPPKNPSRDDILKQLRVQARCINTTADDHSVQKPSVPVFSTGNSDLDSMLPHDGLAVATVTEWVAANPATPAGAIALVAAARRLNRHPGPLVVVAKPEDFYPPAAIALGIPAPRIVWVRPSCHADAVWSIDQSLRCESVAAVWSIVGAQLDDRDARRFQLAAETGQTPGLLVRPTAVRGRPTFADTRFHVAMLPSDASSPTFRITLDRCRGTAAGASTIVQIDDRGQLISSRPTRIETTRIKLTRTSHHETAAVRLAAQLAHPKTAKRNDHQRRA